LPGIPLFYLFYIFWEVTDWVQIRKKGAQGGGAGDKGKSKGQKKREKNKDGGVGDR
jgi:hypothetical protein